MTNSFRRGALSALVLTLVLLLLPGQLEAQVATGVVRDADTGATLSGVRVVSGARTTITDNSGRFQLELPAAAATVQFSRLGYQPLTLEAEQVSGDILLRSEPMLIGAITVEAQGRTKLASGTSLSMTEVDRDEIRASSNTSVAEALEGTAGISVSRPGAWGAQAVVRGLSGERVAVMVDGMQLNRACYFGMDDGLATIDPSTVERVEVLSGPGSTLFGSGSIGGVINVVTRQPTPGEDGLTGEVRAAASSAIPGGSAGGSLNYQQGRFDMAFAGELNGYGDYRAPSGTVDGSSLRTGTANLRLGFRPAPAHMLSVQAQYYAGRDIGWPSMDHGDHGGHDDHGHDDHGHDDHGHDDHGHDDHGHGGHHHEHEMSIPAETRLALSGDWGWQVGRGLLDGISARAYVQSLDHEMYMRMVMHGTEPVTTITEAASNSRTTGGRFQFRLHSPDRAHVDAGMEAVHLAAEANRWVENHHVDGEPVSETQRGWPSVRILDVGAFAQGEFPVTTAFTLTGGARADFVRRQAEGWETTTEWVGTGNLGFRLDLPAGFGFRSTLGYGYRIPDATELFGLATQPDGFVYRGNPELKTETSRNIEGSLTYDTDAFAFEVTAFRNDLFHMIAPALAHDSVAGRPVREYANLNRARLTGVNTTVALSLPAEMMLSGTLSHTRGSDRADGSPLPFIPPVEGGVSLRANQVPVADWVELQFRGAMQQDRINVSAGEIEADAYGVVNLHTGFELAGTNVLAGIDNILDKAYRHHLDPQSLIRPGRNFYVKLTRTF